MTRSYGTCGQSCPAELHPPPPPQWHSPAHLDKGYTCFRVSGHSAHCERHPSANCRHTRCLFSSVVRRNSCMCPNLSLSMYSMCMGTCSTGINNGGLYTEKQQITKIVGGVCCTFTPPFTLHLGEKKRPCVWRLYHCARDLLHQGIKHMLPQYCTPQLRGHHNGDASM